MARVSPSTRSASTAPSSTFSKQRGRGGVNVLSVPPCLRNEASAAAIRQVLIIEDNVEFGCRLRAPLGQVIEKLRPRLAKIPREPICLYRPLQFELSKPRPFVRAPRHPFFTSCSLDMSRGVEGLQQGGTKWESC